MSDRDFIIQEIRKLFQEQEVASNPTRPTATNVEKPPKTTEKPKKQKSNEPEYLKHPSWRQKYAAIADVRQLTDVGVAMNKESNKRALQVAKVIHPKAFFNPTDRGLSVASGESFKNNPEMNHIKNFILVSGNPIPATEEIVKYITRQGNNLPASLGGKGAAPQKAKPSTAAPKGPMKKAVDLVNKNSNAREAINNAAKNEKGALAILKAANLAGKMKTDKEAHEFAAQIAANAAAAAGTDKDNIYQSLSKLVGKGSTALNKAMASLDSGNFVGPMPQDGKVMTAKNTKPTAGYTFQQAKIPEQLADAYNAITPGMDRGEKGNCKFINSAAIKVLGTNDPKYIFTALLNSGVIGSAFKYKAEPCQGLGRLISIFQYKAQQNKLRYQDKIDPDGNITKGLEYMPKVKTQDRSKQAQAAGDEPQLAKTTQVGPTIAEEKQKMTVDGKIGSRTAALLKIYASPNNFAKIAPPAVGKPSGPSAPEPTRATSTGTGAATAKKSPEKKKPKPGCIIDFKGRDLNLKQQTVQTISGVPCNMLGTSDAESFGEPNQFSDVHRVYITAHRNHDISSYRERKTTLVQGILKNEGEIFAEISKKDLQSRADQDKEVFGIPDSSFPDLKGFLERSVSPIIVDLYAGDAGGVDKVYNFACVATDFGIHPLVYITDPSELGQLQGFMGALKHNHWATVEPSKRNNDSFAAPANIGNLLQSLKVIRDRADYFYNNGLGKSAAGSDNRLDQKEVRNARIYIQNHINYIDGFMRDYQQFLSSPSVGALKKLGQSAIPLTTVYKSLIGRKY